jgi:(2Fe-2S) ferredoxin
MMKQYSQHLLFCDGSDCKGKELMKETRKMLGKDSRHVKCSKVSCLGGCKKGNLMLVYPDGVWYSCPNKKALRQIVENHLQGGKPVKQHIIQELQPKAKA